MSVKNELQEFFQDCGLSLPKYTYTRAGGEDHMPRWICQVELPDIEGEGCLSYMSEEYSSKKRASAAAAKIALENIRLLHSPTFSSFERDERIEVEEVRDLGASFVPRSSPRVDPSVKIEKEHTSTFILLDLENSPNSYKELCQKMSVDETYTICAFYSKNSNHIYKKVHDEMTFYRVPVYFYKAHSAHKDAADVRMALFVGEMLGTMRYAKSDPCAYGGFAATRFQAETNGSIILEAREDGSINVKFIIITNDHFGEALGDLINKYYYNSPGEMQVSAEVYHCVSEMI